MLQALADLLPLLVSSEDAAIMAFGRLARDDGFSRASARALRMIEAEERVHFALVDGLTQQLPAAIDARGARQAARAFHAAIATPDAAQALAVVASIDAGTCTILGRLLRRGSVLAQVPHVVAVLTRIYSEEAGHVAVSRRLAMQAANAPRLLPPAHHARAELARLIRHFGNGLEGLGVDTDRLARDLVKLPPRLLA